MGMEKVLQAAVQQLNSGLLTNEAQVKQAVVLPILRGLGWDDTNPAEFVPELSLDDGRVDYALCQTVGNPLVFIEAKRLGSADTKGEEQLFGYASNKGVPFLILTDGNVWDFYLSMAAGVPAERKFYHAELRREEKIPEYARFLEEHLEKQRINTGEARRAAERLHADNLQKKKASEAIPKVWRRLLETPDELLRDLLVEAVEGECGTRPELDDVEEFLKAALFKPAPQPSAIQASPVQSGPMRQSGGSRSKIVGFVLEGKRMEIGVANRTLAEVLKEFQRRDAGFMTRLAPKTVGRTRRLVAQNREDLYEAEDLRESSLDLENGWWLGTNISTESVRRNIKLACQVAGVRFGTQLTLIEG